MKKVTAFVVFVFVVYALALTSFVSDSESKANWSWPAGELSLVVNR